MEHGTDKGITGGHDSNPTRPILRTGAASLLLFRGTTTWYDADHPGGIATLLACAWLDPMRCDSASQKLWVFSRERLNHVFQELVRVILLIKIPAREWPPLSIGESPSSTGASLVVVINGVSAHLVNFVALSLHLFDFPLLRV